MRSYPTKSDTVTSTDYALAKHLEYIRSLHGLSLQEVAIKSGVSRATLSRIERGETSPTANILGKLCSTYKMSMSRLLLALESDAPRHISFDNAAKWRDPESGFTRVALSPPAENYTTELAWGELPEGADLTYDNPPMEGLEQHIVVLKGQLHLTFNSTQFEVNTMDCVALKLHGSSRFRNLGPGNAEYLIVNSKPL